MPDTAASSSGYIPSRLQATSTPRGQTDSTIFSTGFSSLKVMGQPRISVGIPFYTLRHFFCFIYHNIVTATERPLCPSCQREPRPTRDCQPQPLQHIVRQITHLQAVVIIPTTATNASRPIFTAPSIFNYSLTPNLTKIINLLNSATSSIAFDSALQKTASTGSGYEP